MASTYEKIASTTLSSTALTIDFTSISSAYTDIVLIITGTIATGGNTVYCRINGDTGSNYSVTGILGTGTTVGNSRLTNNTNGVAVGGFNGYDTSQFTAILNFNNYANTTTYKTALGRWNQTSSVEANISLWRNTSAINQLTIRNNGSQNFNSGTTATIYGILKAA
jgi:hypothetical protein